MVTTLGRTIRPLWRTVPAFPRALSQFIGGSRGSNPPARAPARVDARPGYNRGLRRRTAHGRDGLQAGALPRLERIHQLCDLVHDHLRPRGDLHDVRVRLAERWADRGVDRLADPLRIRSHGGLL